MLLEKGMIINSRYRIEAHLGSGGMADVYKVWDNHRSTWLALKALRPDLAEDKIFVRRFRREGDNLARLQHPNIVRYYGMEKEGDLVCLLIDFVEGISLRTEISRLDIPFSNERILEVMQPVCSALAYAHKEGIVHCDVKPANIMIERNGRVLLADFGIARMAEGATTMTMAGAGTPAYMAPEQIRGEEPSPQTDIYALGIVLYEMLTGGERPFTGEQANVTGTIGEKVRWEQMNLAPVSPRKYHKQISREVEAVVMKCLEKEPARRYWGAIELLNALQQSLPGRQPAGKPIPVPEPGPEPDRNVGHGYTAPLLKKDEGGNKAGKKIQWWQIALDGSLVIILMLLVRPGGLITLTPTPTPSMTPTLTPTSTSEPQPYCQIAFMSDRDGDNEIYVMNSDGSDVRQLTSNTKSEYFTGWSPDGRQIAFLSDRDGDYEIFVMNADGSDGRQLTSNNSHEDYPVWSPDGRQIAFISDRDGDNEIFVMNADGSDVRQLTSNTKNDFYPVWSPDGRQIAFISDRDGDIEIYVMNSDGSDVRQLTSDDNYDASPAWLCSYRN